MPGRGTRRFGGSCCCSAYFRLSWHSFQNLRPCPPRTFLGPRKRLERPARQGFGFKMRRRLTQDETVEGARTPPQNVRGSVTTCGALQREHVLGRQTQGTVAGRPQISNLTHVPRNCKKTAAILLRDRQEFREHPGVFRCSFFLEFFFLFLRGFYIGAPIVSLVKAE